MEKIQIDNVKMWESLIEGNSVTYKDGKVERGDLAMRIIHAVKEQGYDFKDGHITSIELKTKSIEGEAYKALEDYINPISGHLVWKKGNIYGILKPGIMIGEDNCCMSIEGHEDLFVQVAEKDFSPTYITHNGELNPCKDCPDAMLNCQNFPCEKKQEDSEELTEFEKEVAHVLVYQCHEGSLETEEEIEKAYKQYYKQAKFYAPMLLEKARKQIASEINTEEMSNTYFDFYKELNCSRDTLLKVCQGYRQGIEDVLKKIKGE